MLPQRCPPSAASWFGAFRNAGMRDASRQHLSCWERCSKMGELPLESNATLRSVTATPRLGGDQQRSPIGHTAAPAPLGRMRGLMQKSTLGFRVGFLLPWGVLWGRGCPCCEALSNGCQRGDGPRAKGPYASQLALHSQICGSAHQHPSALPHLGLTYTTSPPNPDIAVKRGATSPHAPHKGKKQAKLLLSVLLRGTHTALLTSACPVPVSCVEINFMISIGCYHPVWDTSALMPPRYLDVPGAGGGTHRLQAAKSWDALLPADGNRRLQHPPATDTNPVLPGPGAGCQLIPEGVMMSTAGATRWEWVLRVEITQGLQCCGPCSTSS